MIIYGTFMEGVSSVPPREHVLSVSTLCFSGSQEHNEMHFSVSYSIQRRGGKKAGEGTTEAVYNLKREQEQDPQH